MYFKNYLFALLFLTVMIVACQTNKNEPANLSNSTSTEKLSENIYKKLLSLTEDIKTELSEEFEEDKELQSALEESKVLYFQKSHHVIKDTNYAQRPIPQLFLGQFIYNEPEVEIDLDKGGHPYPLYHYSFDRDVKIPEHIIFRTFEKRTMVDTLYYYEEFNISQFRGIYTARPIAYITKDGVFTYNKFVHQYYVEEKVSKFIRDIDSSVQRKISKRRTS